jgi:hypothetical protein
MRTITTYRKVGAFYIAWEADFSTPIGLRPALNVNSTWLFQLRVLRFGLLQDGNVGVGVFPKREEIFVGGFAPFAIYRIILGAAVLYWASRLAN